LAVTHRVPRSVRHETAEYPWFSRAWRKSCAEDREVIWEMRGYEMWRACRLVVDTGMHYLGWTRQQAIEFMAANTALSHHNITAEVDRYIAWPGQATAYKMGELKIRALRAEAEKQLGERFDVREFHDVVLAAGAIPLDVLEANVAAYIETEQKSLSN